MSIEFRKDNKFRLDVIDDFTLIGYIFSTSQGVWFEAIDGDEEFGIEQLETILAKMKGLQSPNKDIEFLQADIASLGHLLDMSIERNDPIGKIQLSNRIAQRKRELEELQSEVKK